MTLYQFYNKRTNIITYAKGEVTPSPTSEKRFSIENLLEKLETSKATISIETTANQAKIEASDGEMLIKAVSKYKKKMSPLNVMIAISIICQKGGTSKKAQGNIYATVNGQKNDS